VKDFGRTKYERQGPIERGREIQCCQQHGELGRNLVTGENCHLRQGWEDEQSKSRGIEALRLKSTIKSALEHNVTMMRSCRSSPPTSLQHGTSLAFLSVNEATNNAKKDNGAPLQVYLTFGIYLVS